MASKNSSSSILLVLLFVFTFPIWIGLFGLLIGLIGGFFGVMVGFMGAMVGIIAWPFKMIFGHGHWFPHINGYVIAAIIILIVLVSKRNQKQ